MQQILHLSSSLWSTDSRSYQLGDRLIRRYRDKLIADSGTGSRVVVRDLALEPVPHLDAEQYQAFAVPADQQSERQRQLLATSDRLIAELKASDVIVVDAPLYNFGVPSVLKAWIDQVTRIGETVTYTDRGPKGLLAGKKLYVISTRGGSHLDTPRETQTQYLSTAFGFLGIADIEFIYVEGTGGAQAAENVAAAEQHIDRLLAADSRDTAAAAAV